MGRELTDTLAHLEAEGVVVLQHRASARVRPERNTRSVAAPRHAPGHTRPGQGVSEDPPPSERTRAAMLARHYRDHEHLAVGEIAQRLARTPATISAYLYDPTGAKTREVKRRYQGICETVAGSPTWGAGPRHAGRLCARCNGRATLQWQP